MTTIVTKRLLCPFFIKKSRIQKNYRDKKNNYDIKKFLQT